MLLSSIISIITIITMIIAIIYFPVLKIKTLKVQSFWIVSLLGAIAIVLTRCLNIEQIKTILLNSEAMNPVEILILFISMSILSITLDVSGFFKLCAYYATSVTKNSQKKLFVSIMVVVSILTIFTSNDIVILTFTPFICYFAKHAKINPLPYLIGEFIFANTWSMMLIIGNPTNIFLSSIFNIRFLDYLKVMAIPTIISGIVALFILMAMFNKQLSQPLVVSEDIQKPKIKKTNSIIGMFHLSLCTMFLIVSSYIEIQMWVICAIFALSMSVFLIGYDLVNKKKNIVKVYKRAPWNLIPFVLSMFIIVGSLNENGVIKEVAKLFNNFAVSKASTIYYYGFSSFFLTNVLNNIPMSVMFEKIITSSNQLFLKEAIYSTIISSNIGAYFTPIGALAGIMWMSILNKVDVKMSFKKFIKYGGFVSLIIILLALTCLLIIL